MATQIDLDKLLQQDNFTLDINTISPTARDILLQKNLIVSKNLSRSPIYKDLLDLSNNNFNTQTVIIDNKDLKDTQKDWVDDVGGYNQKMERDNLLYQNLYRDAIQTEYSIDSTVAGNSTNAYDTFTYLNTDESGVIKKDGMTSNNVGNIDQATKREELLSQNIYLNNSQDSFSVDGRIDKKTGVDFVKQAKASSRYPFFDINFDIEQDNFDFSWKNEASSLMDSAMDTIESKTGLPIQTGYEIIKNVLSPDESQFTKDGFKGLTTQLGYNIAQNTRNLLTSGLESLLGGSDPFKVMRYEITTADSSATGIGGILNTATTITEELTGIKKQYNIPDQYAVVKKETDNPKINNSILDLFPTDTFMFDWFGFYNNRLKFTGKGQSAKLIKQLNLNKYKPAYYYNKQINIPSWDGQIYDTINHTINSKTFQSLQLSIYDKPGGIEFTGWKNNDTTQTVSKFSWEEGNGIQKGNYFNDAANSFDENSLLGKTKKLVDDGKIESLINRKGKDSEKTEIQSAVNSLGEISRGNNVLKKSFANKTYQANGIDEFCRVWTFHDQYDRGTKFIRNTGLKSKETIIKKSDGKYYNSDNSMSVNESVLDDTGRVTISPYNDNADQLNNPNWSSLEDGKLSTKKYMLSIENLAWSDSLDSLHPSEIGNGDPDNRDNRGRIMWFPPYNLTFGKSINTNLTKTDFIGRGEPLITYNNTSSSMTLGFSLLVDHPSYLNENRNEFLSSDWKTGEIDGDYNRFFAGCFDLETKTIIPEPNPEPKPKPETRIDTEPLGVQFEVYFPNDVSDKVYDYLNTGADAYEIGTTDYSSAISIPVDERWELTKKLNIGDEDFVKKSTVEIKPFRTGLKFDIVPETVYPIQTDKDSKNIETFTYKLNISKDEKFDVGNGTQLIEKLFFLAPSEVRTTHRYNREYKYLTDSSDNTQVYKKRYGFNDVLNNLINKTNIEEPKYKELKAIVKAANDPKNISKDKKLYITIQARASFDGSVKGWGTAKTRINGFLAARRANTVLTEILPKIFTNDFDISKIDNSLIQLKVELYSDQEEKGKNKPGDFESTKGRRAFINIATTAEKITELTSLKATKTVDEAKVESNERTITDYRKNLPNEVNYFKKIKKEDKFVWDRLTQKVDYFHPVFHSQTPESLSTRLTFLEQCTRQGPTLGNSGSAYNLAFGKQPVCILRIGDFVHTKVFVESLTIAYEPLIWDLNPEGIGVQPMLANITLNLIPIGGQDITGPINELQNAVSFNYYANTSIFDPRAKVNDTTYKTYEAEHKKREEEKNKKK